MSDTVTGAHAAETYGATSTVETDQWRPMATAPKEKDDTGLSPRIMLGFAPDEEDYTLPSCEGYWRNSQKPGWVSCMDPDVPNPYSQPTHWMPLPPPPTGDSKTT